MSQAGVLKELEALLDQFFSGTSTNEQRHEINKILENFSQQQSVWRYCVHFLQHSENQHVLMYSLNLIENLVTRMWISLDPAEQAELRHFLMQHTIIHQGTLPPFIRNKLIKVIVLVGRADWPQRYPEFFSHILQLVRNPETTPLGLSLLNTASEELATPNSDLLTSQRKDELTILMQQQVPTILSVVMNILEVVAEKQRHSVTPTPPPSPNVSPIKHVVHTPPHPSTPSPFTTSSGPHHLSSPIQRYLSLPTSVIVSPTRITPIVAGNAPYAPLDSKTEEICSLALKCLSHLFSWMSLSSVITPNILETMFHFASLGCDSGTDITENSGNLGSLAMDCINELLIKNCVPKEFEAFLMKLFEKSFSLLQRLTEESERGITCNFSKLDDRFLAKCSDFFYWFVSSHLKRVEYNHHFPVLEFLGLFSQYTFKQPGQDSFCVCLDTWGVFLDHLIMMSTDSRGRQSPPSNNHYERYKDILLSMMERILHKLLLHYNIDELREIDDDAIDDDNETEWQSFLRQCLEFVAKVAELFPQEAFRVLLPLLETYSQVYVSLSQVVRQEGAHNVLMISEGSECEKLHAVLKDLTSVLQAMGRLAEHFMGDYYSSRFTEAQLLVKKFCTIADYSSKMMLFNTRNPVPEILDHDFIELHAQVLGTLQAFTHWLSQFYLDCLRHPDHASIYETLVLVITTIVDASTPLIDREVPEKITLAACQLLLSVSTTVRPKFLPSLPSVQELMRRAAKGVLVQLPSRVYTMVHRFLCLMLVLPWPETIDSGQQWEERSTELVKLVSGCTTIFQQLQQAPGWTHNSQLLDQVKPDIKRALNLLEDLVSSVAYERSKCKSILFKALSPTVEFITTLFPVFLQQADVLEQLMGFFLTLFCSLKVQVGPALTERTTQTFMSLLTREHLEGTLIHESSHGCKVVEKFLRILQQLVQDPGGADKAFLPSIISFVMNQIYPIISESGGAPDINAIFYELLLKLLLNNWRYFFSANVLSHMDSDDLNEPLEHDTEFFKIIESFGSSFLRTDIATFKQNLGSLQTLNTKHKLYSKVQFRSCMLYPFLQLLFQVLVQKSHDLLQEEICLCVYSMAAVDIVTYHREFLPKFLGSVENLSTDQQGELVKNYKMDEDLPSFVRNLRVFINDLRYFLLLNKSVPSGCAKLS